MVEQKKQFQFAFTSQEEYDQDARINIENSGFFQSFEEWLEQQSFNGNLPELGEKKNPISIETLNSGYLYDMNGENCQVSHRVPLNLCTGGINMPEKKSELVGRHKRVAYMNTDATGSSPKFERMTNFTTMTNGKNPKEYSRQYVDEIAERADVVGYAPAIEYSFDRYTNNPVHEKIATIHDGEKLGDDAHVEVVVVDFFKKNDKGDKCYATKRTYAVIPDSDGDGTDALV